MRVALVVPGRFHAFDLARALGERGHEVTVFTNYPRWAVARFGIPRASIRSFPLHGMASRVAWSLKARVGSPYPEVFLYTTFGRWAATQVQQGAWDLVHCWSGISEEFLQQRRQGDAPAWLARGSAHIRTQATILHEEARRAQVRLDQPSPWMIAREEREYALADQIVVLSRFAYETFIHEGVAADKLRLCPLGAQVEAFRPPEEVVEARCRRIRAGDPLRVLYVGALSFRKGLYDLATIVQRLGGDSFRYRVVGPLLPEGRRLLAHLQPLVEHIPTQPQHALPPWYAWGDLFLYPTLEDGYAMVLAQAQAGALPIVTTTNCAGPDLLHEGRTGWIVPIRQPEAIIERLRWCQTHRHELATMARAIYQEFRPRDWAQVAADFEALALRR